MSAKTVLVNIGKIKEIINSPASEYGEGKLGSLLKNAHGRIQSIDKLSGCKCDNSPKKNIVYTEILSVLNGMTLDEIQPLKLRLGADTLILGGGRTI